MKLLITGAFGNLGLMCVDQALQMGFQVKCFDPDNKNSKKLADNYGSKIEVTLGDLRDEKLLYQLIEDVDAIIHNASVLPPTTEDNPSLAYDINVVACKKLIRVAEVTTKKPTFIFPSSVTVFGLPDQTQTPKKADDPVKATDNYTTHKLEIENFLKNSSIPWVVLRVGVSVDARTLKTDRKTFKQLLNIKADNPLEYVHPKDVAYAMCKAACTEEAVNKILLIGGGESCQVTHKDFINTAFESLGISLPLSVHGKGEFYTHWMDTTESQKLLQYQRHNFSAYRQEMAEKLKIVNCILRPLRWLIRLILPGILRLL
ncbi:MAG: NAD(P)-dependent oxidoreductase [Cellvibrionales bacterium]|nr:NAD(P)-dependent oxidoreductase [Cellvibrionales bacterium]